METTTANRTISDCAIKRAGEAAHLEAIAQNWSRPEDHSSQNPYPAGKAASKAKSAEASESPVQSNLLRRQRR